MAIRREKEIISVALSKSYTFLILQQKVTGRAIDHSRFTGAVRSDHPENQMRFKSELRVKDLECGIPKLVKEVELKKEWERL